MPCAKPQGAIFVHMCGRGKPFRLTNPTKDSKSTYKKKPFFPEQKKKFRTVPNWTKATTPESSLFLQREHHRRKRKKLQSASSRTRNATSRFVLFL